MNNSQLIVIKVGSQLMTDEGGDSINLIANQIHQLIEKGFRIVLISSGAVALGQELILSVNNMSKKAKLKSLYATVGQDEVIARWKKRLAYPVGQILVDREHLSDRKHFVQTYQLIHQMVQHRLIPIINENDALSSGRKKLGNNDLLSAYIATMIGARWLVLMTDVAAVYRDFPICKEPIESCSAYDEALALYSSGKTSSVGTGGMASKVQAARIAARKGTDTLITNPNTSILQRINGEAHMGTWIKGAETSEESTKAWLKDTSVSRGQLVIDLGAVEAISVRGASLLLPGLVEVSGHFHAKEVVDVIEVGTGRNIAKGFSRFASGELSELLRMSQWMKNSNTGINMKKAPIVVHRNDLAVTDTLNSRREK